MEREVKVAQPKNDRADVHAVFVNPGVANGIMNLDWVEFGKAK